MKRTAAILLAIACCAAGSAYGIFLTHEGGNWPEDWPAELEPLREQSRTVEGPLLSWLQYVIPFANRDEFEAAWPQLLKVKSEGAPIVLLAAPDSSWVTPMNAGVRVHAPPRDPGARSFIERQTKDRDPSEQWKRTATYLVLVVDGEIVDLNRIRLPKDTPIIDQRFPDEDSSESVGD